MWSLVTIHNYDQAWKNRPCEYKLHQVIFLLISYVQNVHTIPFPLAAEESALNSPVLMEILLQ